MEPVNSDVDLIDCNFTKNHLLDDIFDDVSLFHPGLAINCVAFGFHEGCMKVLLIRVGDFDKWLIPSGFVYKDEAADSAAYRILNKYTGIENVYLKQYGFFGDVDRTDGIENWEISEGLNIHEKTRKWFADRFVSVAYYSLIQHDKLQKTIGRNQEYIKWFKLSDLPELYADHKRIIDKAINAIRLRIGYIPIGYELLPDKFTLPELRMIYETIVGHEIDRRNFQRKVLSIGLVRRLNESRKGGAYKSPMLYTFVREKYEAVENGTLIADLRVLTT